MGTHPIFESDFDCLTDMMNRIPSRATTLVSRRTYLNPGVGNATWKNALVQTKAHGEEIVILMGYLSAASLFCLWQMVYSTTIAKTEITTIPYVSKDYNAAGGRVNWNKGDQRCTMDRTKDSFYNQSAWKDELQELLARSTRSNRTKLCFGHFSNDVLFTH